MSHDHIKQEMRTARWLMISYITYIASIAIPFLALIGLAITLLRKTDAKNTWMQGHFSMQLQTVLSCLLVGIISFLLAWKSVPASLAVLITSELYFVFKMTTGLYRFTKQEPLPRVK